MARPSSRDVERAKLRQVIRARVDGVVDELVDVLIDRVEVTITDALEVARSAVGTEIAAEECPADVPPDEVEDGQPEDVATNMADAIAMVTGPSGRAPNSCSKCGAVGFTARSCGTSHNFTGRDTKTENAAPAPVASKKDRFAAIEAAAAMRRGAGA